MSPSIAVFGAGSIGCYVGGSLLARGLGVTLIGRERIGVEIAEHGLTVLDGEREIGTTQKVRYDLAPDALEGADIILVCTKLGALDDAVTEIARRAKDNALVVTLQNGIGISERVSPRLPRQSVVAGIVGYNVIHAGSGRWAKASSGDIHAEDHPLLRDFGWHLVEDMRPVEWGKLLLNLNNAINALSGVPLKQQLKQSGYRLVLAAAIEETLAVAKAEEVEPATLGPVPPAMMAKGLGAPDWLFNTIMLPRQKISENARLSMSADYDAGKVTEIDELNGKIVALGRSHGIKTPVNAALTKLIASSKGHLSADAMVRAVGLA